MKQIQIRAASEELAAMRCLYADYLESLPRGKRELPAPTLPSDLAVNPGLICFEDERPTAALLWRTPADGIVMAEFYAESPKASEAGIERLLAEFLRANGKARARYFELWTAEEARMPAELRTKGFETLPRRLLAMSRPVPGPPLWNEFRFLPLRNFEVSPASLQSLGSLLHEGYKGTSDGAFYDEYRQVETCTGYVSRVLRSPLCDLRNSWLAWSPSANQLAGVALCYIWPRARTLYLEQLVIHPTFRRRGLGRALLSSVCSPLAEGLLQRVLLTVSSGNQPAEGLFRAAQAETVSGETAFVLRK